MSLERWRGRSLSSSTLALPRSRSVVDYTPIRRSLSALDLSSTDYYYDVINNYRPWYSKFYYTSPYDDVSYFRNYYSSLYYPYNYYRTRRILGSTFEPTFNYYSLPKYRSASWWYDLDDPYYYRRPYSSYYDYPYRYWTTPSYYESKLYDWTTPYYRSYGSYYPRSYYFY